MMMKGVRTLAMVIFPIAGFVACGPLSEGDDGVDVQASEAQSKGDLVAATILENPVGTEFTIDGVGTFRIGAVRSLTAPTKKCRVDLTSLKSQIRAKWSRDNGSVAARAGIWTWYRSKIEGDKVICSGTGSDCAVWSEPKGAGAY